MQKKFENNQGSVCIVVPVFNRISLTERFIRSLLQSTYNNFTLVIVDDGSTDGTFDFISSNYCDVVVLRGNGDLWWAGATNLGVKYAIRNNYDYVLTLNNDSEVEADTLNNLVKTAHDNPNSLIGSRIMLNRLGTIWSLGVLTLWDANSFLQLNHYNENAKIIQTLHNPLTTDCLTGNGTLIPVEIFRKIGLYESFWCPQYHGDTEFTLRAKSKGFPSVVALNAVVYNNEFVSEPKLRILDELFSKKSHHYWRPIVYVFLKYSPLRYKFKLNKNFKWLKIRIKNKLKNIITDK